MAKKGKITGQESKVLYMTNDIGGQVFVFRDRIEILFTHSRIRKFYIAIDDLYRKIVGIKSEPIPMGRLIFEKDIDVEEGVSLVGIHIDTKADFDLATVSLFELKEALYYFVG